MKKAEIIKNGNLNLTNIEIKEEINLNFMKNHFDDCYQEIELAIMEHLRDGDKTAGFLTRKIIKTIKKKNNIK
jgi:hypothetical protein